MRDLNKRYYLSCWERNKAQCKTDSHSAYMIALIEIRESIDELAKGLDSVLYYLRTKGASDMADGNGVIPQEKAGADVVAGARQEVEKLRKAVEETETLRNILKAEADRQRKVVAQLTKDMKAVKKQLGLPDEPEQPGT